jgi:hypothetical protein
MYEEKQLGRRKPVLDSTGKGIRYSTEIRELQERRGIGKGTVWRTEWGIPWRMFLNCESMGHHCKESEKVL